jgi:translation initiation factor 2B subunit (eIF-2B alpha/beta/delta family)
MNIEISPRQYWKRLNYYDALLYLSILNIDGKEGWRLPNNFDVKEPLYDIIEQEHIDGIIWYDGMFKDMVEPYVAWEKITFSYVVIPVRDI